MIAQWFCYINITKNAIRLTQMEQAQKKITICMLQFSNNNINNSLILTDEILNDKSKTEEKITDDIIKEESYTNNQKIKLY